ncbi:2-oxo acid dehydrogenase subunit E2 [Halomonas elongata]|uniref:2-oxo acid dehydrogenase subunit E2 n=1 Tax=Halomonas elongata TaxID=2746 RepID=UPI0038D3D9B6
MPHFYLTIEVVLDQMLQMRVDINSSLVGHGIRVSLNDMFIKALALALEAHPQCNVTFANDRLLLYKRVDIFCLHVR